MKFNTTFLCCFIFWAVSVSGQSDLLKGKLIDAATIEPVAFATIAVKGRALGVVSNYDGSFSVPEKFKTYGDTLEISSMGFQNRKILISTLSVDKVRRIYLQPALFELDEAVVKGKRKRKLSARQIVKRAINNIPANYPQNLFSTVGYYRDYQFREGDYFNLNEAIFEVYDKGFSSVDSVSTKVQIYDYEKNIDFERDTLADDPYDYKRLQKIIDNAYLSGYGGNEFQILRIHDAIRNYNHNSYSFVNRFDSDLLKNHQFFRDNSTYINGEAVYNIRFRKNYTNYTAHGKLYISHGDFAIHKMEYTVYDERKKLPKGTLNKQNGRGQLLFETVTEYRRKYNRMYLNYISFHNGFILWEPPKFKVDYITAQLTYDEGVPVGFRFVVEYNQIPNNIEAIDLKNYTVRYRGKQVKISAAGNVKEKVFLVPDITLKERDTMISEFIEARKQEIDSTLEKKIDLKKLLSIDVKPITDIDGNILNKWEKKEYNQFREYFVQQVKTNPSVLSTVLFMNKTKPIFEDQHISPPKNFDDYWMNTPLQSIEN